MGLHKALGELRARRVVAVDEARGLVVVQAVADLPMRELNLPPVITSLWRRPAMLAAVSDWSSLPSRSHTPAVSVISTNFSAFSAAASAFRFT